jgi:hypothetical protein
MPEVGDDPVSITLDDLPLHSVWPKRLLSLEPFATRRKTAEEVLREFQDERWGTLLALTRAMPNPSLSKIERAYTDLDKISPCFNAGGFYLASQRYMLNQHLDLYSAVLSPYLNGASCFVELGAGFGSKIFGLATRENFATLPLIAGEYTQSGRDLISILARALKKPIAVGHCDFLNLNIDGISIPRNAVIFTSYAVHYIPELSADFVKFFAKLAPRAVIHFEPCYEHYSLDSLHGLMCRRYVELNDYTRNLVTVIEEGCASLGISVRTRKNVMGSNPFLPISVIEWTPSGQLT